MLTAEHVEMAWYIPLLIYVARIGDVSISTVRTIILINGHKLAAACLGFCEVIIWVLAVGGALRYVSEPLALIGYAGGYASGIYIGMSIEQRIAVGYRMIRVISRDRTRRVATALREKGFAVTEVDGRGIHGPVEIAFLAVRRRNIQDVRAVVQETDPEAFLTVEACEKPGSLTAAAANGRRSLFTRAPWMAGGFMRR